MEIYMVLCIQNRFRHILFGIFEIWCHLDTLWFCRHWKMLLFDIGDILYNFRHFHFELFFSNWVYVK